MSTKRKPKPSRPELLGAIEALGLKARDAEAAAGVPAGFLSKAKSGKCSTARAEASWEKVSTFLRARGARVPGPPAPILEVEDDEPAVAELRAAIRAAKTGKRLAALSRSVLDLMASGTLSPSLGTALLEGVRETRQCVRVAREERGVEKLRALEVLFPAEVELLAAFRTLVGGPPLEPGEAVQAAEPGADFPVVDAGRLVAAYQSLAAAPASGS